jgi:hypothetical protein
MYKRILIFILLNLWFPGFSQTCLTCNTLSSTERWIGECCWNSMYSSFDSKWDYRYGCFDLGTSQNFNFSNSSDICANPYAAYPSLAPNYTSAYTYRKSTILETGSYRIDIEFNGTCEFFINDINYISLRSFPMYSCTRTRSITVNLSGDYNFRIRNARDGSCSNYTKFTITKLSSVPSGKLIEPITTIGQGNWYVSTQMPELNVQKFTGYYIQNAASSSDPGLASENVRSASRNPTYSGLIQNDGSLWVGPVDAITRAEANYIIMAKRKGFPCGRYKVAIDLNADSIAVLINGVIVVSRTTTSTARKITTGSYTLNDLSVMQIYHKSSTTSGAFKVSIIPAYDQLALNAEQQTCNAVKGNTNYDFVSNTSNLVGSVNPNGSDLGQSTLTAYLSPTNQVLNGLCVAATRHFLLSTTQLPTTPIRVSIPISTQEFNRLMTNASSLNSSPVDDVNNISDLRVSYYSNPQFADDIATNNTSSFIVMNPSTYTNTRFLTSDQSYFLEVLIQPTSLKTEFWLNGNSVSISPLGNEDIQLAINCVAPGQFQTTCELNQFSGNKGLLKIELSNDGSDWITAFSTTEPAELNNRNISFQNEKYIRLTETNEDGLVQDLFMDVLTCGQSGNELSVTPNPVLDEVTINLFKNSKIHKTEFSVRIELIDAQGKLIQAVDAFGHSTIETKISTSDLTPGYYLIRVITDELQEIRKVQKI